MDLIHQDSLETKSRISTITLFGKNLWCNRQGCSSQILSQLENLFVIQLIPISYSIRQHRERHVLRLSSMGTHSGCPRRGWLTFSEWMCELSEEATIRKIGIVQSEGDSAWSIPCQWTITKLLCMPVPFPKKRQGTRPIANMTSSTIVLVMPPVTLTLHCSRLT